MDAQAVTIAIGVTGHRLERLDPGQIDGARDAVDAVLAAIVRSAAGCGSNVTFRLVTGLADGADSIIASAAIARGWPVDAVLAFPDDEFALDFIEGTARDDHIRRLAQARTVFALPGQRSTDGSGVAYEQVGHIVLAQCDILLALWDNAPARGPGGAAHIVANAVLQNVPVIHIDPANAQVPTILWDGLQEHDLGTQTVDTVPRGGLDRLPALLDGLVRPPSSDAETAQFARFMTNGRRRAWFAFAYPLLLRLTGVRAGRRTTSPAINAATLPDVFTPPARAMVRDRYQRADAIATHFARVFRSGYVTNFSFAAIAVVLSLLGLAMPPATKPLLIVLELATIGAILATTRRGNRAEWHRQWLDNRQLAERLRCLAVSAQLGDLQLRNDDAANWVAWLTRATARSIGLPAARVDATYLARVRGDLLALVDDQIAYLSDEAMRMHALEHRLHRLGTALFAMTAFVCVALLAFKIASEAEQSALMAALAHPIVIGATILSAALPAIGAAIYGIRMQGDFAGTAERSERLSHQLSVLRRVVAEDSDDFDTLRRRVQRATTLLTEDLASWLATYHARPLTLPG